MTAGAGVRKAKNPPTGNLPQQFWGRCEPKRAEGAQAAAGLEVRGRRTVRAAARSFGRAKGWRMRASRRTLPQDDSGGWGPESEEPAHRQPPPAVLGEVRA